ncbi:MAG: undecaprenyldiphospho-muramoylpentapeptide beta-N-acetylglucosaminyltransferase [Ignavibacteriales bacterium]|nr:MAG: undecaprenyldiphospho-muramoylpentapeptide beta-N-acetylglucosaminyltransferase [Ignavibacteriales bacterium]
MARLSNPYRFLLAGGGTGGHLFPAVAVAEKIKLKKPEAEILFVGTKTRIEGKVIPELGYKFKSIWIKGFSRKMTIENLLFPLKVVVSVFQSILISLKFKPKVVIGSGGYVAGPAVFGAKVTGSKVILLEQNSYPGVTTRILERYANDIHITFDDSKKYFKNKEKLRSTGNPVRHSLVLSNRTDALKYFGLIDTKKTLLVLGGSLGAASINSAIAASLTDFEKEGIQVIWQTGKNYFEQNKNLATSMNFISAFIERMDLAYSACDLVLARAGATTISELTVLGLPSVLVPSPNVAENHQYYNAKSLEFRNAALLIKDAEIHEKILLVVSKLINDNHKLDELKNNSLLLAKPEAADIIADNAIKLAEA